MVYNASRLNDFIDIAFLIRGKSTFSAPLPIFSSLLVCKIFASSRLFVPYKIENW